MTEHYIGIDYSLGQSNFDKETGIHYGIISTGDVPSYIWDDLESNYAGPFCPKCGNDAVDYDTLYNADDGPSQEEIDTYSGYERGCADYICVGCQYVFDSSEAFSEEATDHTYEDEQYSLMADTDGDLWVFHSPYYSLSAYCSPCAPGAGNLRAPRNNGVKTYCLGPEYWPEERDMPDQVCPYPVWRVSDDVQIYCPYDYSDHTYCSVCLECITCNLRPCRDGGEHTPYVSQDDTDA